MEKEPGRKVNRVGELELRKREEGVRREEKREKRDGGERRLRWERGCKKEVGESKERRGWERVFVEGEGRGRKMRLE